MSPEQEQQIVDALTDPNLNWMRDAFDFAYQTITWIRRESIDCHPNHAPA